MADIVQFDGVTYLDLDPNVVLEAAIDQLESCVIVGYDKDGNEYFASSIASGAEANWIMDRCKRHLLDTVDED